MKVYFDSSMLWHLNNNSVFFSFIFDVPTKLMLVILVKVLSKELFLSYFTYEQSWKYVFLTETLWRNQLPHLRLNYYVSVWHKLSLGIEFCEMMEGLRNYRCYFIAQKSFTMTHFNLLCCFKGLFSQECCFYNCIFLIEILIVGKSWLLPPYRLLFPTKKVALIQWACSLMSAWVSLLQKVRVITPFLINIYY